MELADLISQAKSFDGMGPREKIKLFAWYLHAHRDKDTFTNADIRSCFSQLHLADPNTAKYLARMVTYGDLMKVRDSFKLERAARVDLDKLYGVHHSIVQVSKLLNDLLGNVPDLAERNFLGEAIKCYRVEAYRACVVMTWNLAYSHLLHWILADSNRLKDFNSAIVRRYPKKTSIVIGNYDDFGAELKESEVVEICNSGSLINPNITKILKEKLDRRNMAAHPSAIVIVQSQADDVITDLVNNVVLALK